MARKLYLSAERVSRKDEFEHRKYRSVKLGLYGAEIQGRTTTMAISPIFDIENITVIPPVGTSNLRGCEILKYCVFIVHQMF